MNAIEFLKNQHREVEALFEQIENIEEDNKERRQLMDELSTKLDAHAKIEEKIFYPEGMEVDEDTTLEAYEEHGVMKDLLRKISRLKGKDETFSAKVCVLKEVVEHHVEEEENEYFPECEKEWGDVKLEELGQELEKKFEAIVGKTRSKGTRESTKRKSPKAA